MLPPASLCLPRYCRAAGVRESSVNWAHQILLSAAPSDHHQSSGRQGCCQLQHAAFLTAATCRWRRCRPDKHMICSMHQGGGRPAVMTPAATDVPAMLRYLRPSLGTELLSFPHHDAGCMPCASKTGLQSKTIPGQAYKAKSSQDPAYTCTWTAPGAGHRGWCRV